MFLILGDPGAGSRGERQIKRAKSVQAEAWCERKFTGREQCGKTADWLFISRVLALSADQSKAAPVN